jgi:hypothetical protein
VNGLIVDLFSGSESRPFVFRRHIADHDPLTHLRAHLTTKRPCVVCGGAVRSARRDARFCSQKCQNVARCCQSFPTTIRQCKTCPRVFVRLGRYEGNHWHCSKECAAVSARKSRLEFKRRRPERDAIYRARQRSKPQCHTTIKRLWKKFPELPRACEACGEARVLDVAHRPEHARNGAWQTLRNSTPDKIWILCPLCHALLDRLGFTAEQLCIVPRGEQRRTA